MEPSPAFSSRAWAGPAPSRYRSHLAHTCVRGGGRGRPGRDNGGRGAADGGPRLRTDRRAQPAGDPRGGARGRRRCWVPGFSLGPSGSAAPSRAPGRVSRSRPRPRPRPHPRLRPAGPSCPAASPPPPERTRAAGSEAGGGRAIGDVSAPGASLTLDAGNRRPRSTTNSWVPTRTPPV
ncbi:translation initiation factor IF-2-like [Lutra lutra]|uniref:translation initiation factor IF-2-like n=1 Tax=Lutra lutra TaxID=9657 RepID=UPI001FCFDEAA|nr:translation initiation factor IF-2-like [Lutra lutra]